MNSKLLVGNLAFSLLDNFSEILQNQQFAMLSPVVITGTLIVQVV